MRDQYGLHSGNEGCNLFLKIGWKRILSVLTVLLMAVFLFMAAGKKEESREVYKKDLFAMDTYFTIKAYGPEGESALALCEEKVRELERLFSVTKEGSDVWNINHNKNTSVNEDTFLLISGALELCEITGGALDISLYPVLREWGFTTEQYQIPEPDRLRGLLKNVNYQNIACEEEAPDNPGEAGQYILSVPRETEIDLGSVAKGYTGDCLLEILKEQGIRSAILDLGGNVQTLGTKPDGSLWQVAVKDPFDVSRTVGVLQIDDKCVITSGSYERFFVGGDGKKYWHILDPGNGCPADKGLLSVTVVGEEGLQCDALSTALFVMGREDAIAFWRADHEGLKDFEMLMISEDGTLYLTEGLEDSFECSEGWNAEIIYKK